MRAKLKDFMTSDIDPETFWPDEEDDFGFYVQATIGPENEEGGDVFGFQVCTPKWLANEYGKESVILARHIIIVFEYDFYAVRKKISDLCNKTLGNDWAEIAPKLARYGYWEFEDYKPAS